MTLAAGLVTLAGCAGECCFIDVTSSAVLEGWVTDTLGMAVEAARLSPVGLLGYTCSVTTNPLSAEPDPSSTDADGRFRITLTTGDGPGTHCFDLEVARIGRAPDTVRDLQAIFRLVSEPTDLVTAVDIVLDP